MGERLLFLSDAQVRDLLTMKDALDICEQAFQAMAAGKVTWGEPPMLDLKQGGGRIRYYVKACSVDTIPAAGFRVVGYGHNVEGRISGTDTRHIVLLDPHDTRKLMIMDEHWTYALRTAASAGVAARYLGRRESRIGGLLGAGWMARACVWALREAFPAMEEIRVTSRRPETRERFAAETTREFGIRVVPADTAEATVRDADIIIAATTAEEPIVRTAWLRPGSFTYAMGGGREVDEDVYHKADKVLVDDWAHCVLIPEFAELVARGILSRDTIYGELAEVVGGLKPGRESDRERTFVRSQGLAVQDIAIAHHVYQLACQRGIGVWLDS